MDALQGQGQRRVQVVNPRWSHRMSGGDYGMGLGWIMGCVRCVQTVCQKGTVQLRSKPLDFLGRNHTSTT